MTDTSVIVRAEVELELIVHGKVRKEFQVEGHFDIGDDWTYPIHIGLYRLQYWRESSEDWCSAGEDDEKVYLEHHRQVFIDAVLKQWKTALEIASNMLDTK